MSSIWLWFKSIFISKTIGSLLRIILINAGNIIVSQLLDKANQEKAYEFVKELHAKNMPGIQKAHIFNQQMLNWAKENGKKAISNSVLNCLRELALTALKAENNQEN